METVKHRFTVSVIWRGSQSTGAWADAWTGLQWQGEVEGKEKRRETKRCDREDNMLQIHCAAFFLICINHNMYCLYIYIHIFYIRTVLQFYRNPFFWIGSLWRHVWTRWKTHIDSLAHWIWVLHPGSACEGRTLLLCVDCWSDSYGRWWRSVHKSWISYDYNLVEVGDGGILFFIIMLGAAGLPIQRRGSHWGILGTRKTWRVEKGSSLIPLQKAHIQHVWVWIVWIMCPDIFLYKRSHSSIKSSYIAVLLL